jgi:Uma2 family endonuclease
MPTALLTPQISTVPASPPRKHWTRAEISAIESAGLLAGQKLELIEGELILKMGKNRKHSIGLLLMLDYLLGVFTQPFLQQEMPIDVHPEDFHTSEPEPDLVVLKHPALSIRVGNPRPSDIRLVCEISDTSVNFDLSIKAALYSRAGIEEYWVLDLMNSRLVVHREPSATGFQSVQVYRPDESIAPLAAPHAQKLVAAFFS